MEKEYNPACRCRSRSEVARLDRRPQRMPVSSPVLSKLVALGMLLSDDCCLMMREDVRGRRSRTAGSYAVGRAEALSRGDQAASRHVTTGRSNGAVTQSAGVNNRCSNCCPKACLRCQMLSTPADRCFA